MRKITDKKAEKEICNLIEKKGKEGIFHVDIVDVILDLNIHGLQAEKIFNKLEKEGKVKEEKEEEWDKTARGKMSLKERYNQKIDALAKEHYLYPGEAGLWFLSLAVIFCIIPLLIPAFSILLLLSLILFLVWCSSVTIICNRVDSKEKLRCPLCKGTELTSNFQRIPYKGEEKC